MKRNEIKTQIEEVEMELADLYSMSEEAACFRYNVDNKQEAIDLIGDELTELYKKERELLKEDEEPSMWVTPGFRDEVEFSKWKGVR